MTLVQITMAVIRKDLVLEWRSQARLGATVTFAMLTLLLFSFAMGAEAKLLRAGAPGFLWLALLLASTMSLSESMRVELENNALEGLRLLPVDSRALFLGKAVINTLLLWLLSMLMVPIAIALYDVPVSLGLLPLVGVLFIGSAAISAPGTLYAGITAQARASDILLPLMLFPILVPALLAAVKATSLILLGDPMGNVDNWVTLLGAFTVVYWFLCLVLFGRVVEI